MPPLRSLLALPRILRHGPAVGADLPPDEAVVLDTPAAPLRAALAAAGSGDCRPARDLLSGTRLGAEWERRDVYVSRLAESALLGPGWLEAWLAEVPEDPDAALVTAELRVRQAWEIRSGARARDISEDRFHAFFTLLEDAVPVIGAAAELNPTDPVPWRIALTHARGIQAPREVFDAYWEQAVRRAPHHYGCHVTAQQYLCEKWYGSHEEMFAFAEHAAEHALPGSLLHALPLLAAVEYAVEYDGPQEDGPVVPARLDAAITRAQELSGWYDPGDPEAAGFRNHLVLLLVRGERWTEALDTFRAIGIHATGHPWRRLADDPREAFLSVRAGVRMRIARRTPFFGRPPRPAAAPADADWLPRAIAIADAPAHKVAQAVLLCGTTLRLAPAPDGRRTFVELATDPAPRRPGMRDSVLGESRLAGATDAFTTGEKWPALVVRRTGDRYGITLFQRGKRLAAHEWDPAAPVPSLDRAAATARALAAPYGITDPRPLTALLRGSDDPARRQADTVALLGLPALPSAFGSRAEVLDSLPGAHVVARRGFLRGLGATLTADGAGLPAPHPRRWWVWRIVALPLLFPLTAYAWWSPGVPAWRAAVVTLLTLYVANQLTAARRNRPR